MHIFSIILMANTVRNELSKEDGIQNALEFFRSEGISKLYVESFRDGVFIEKELLISLRDRFEAEGFTVCGCVTTTGLPKASDHWNAVACYSVQSVRDKLAEIFTRTAEVFDTIMIDDFLFTDCRCEECEKKRGGRNFDEYVPTMLNRISREYILKPAHDINPKCKVIIKYPLWYEDFQKRGYDVIRQTRDFDLIWAGNESREPDSAEWGRYPQTQSFYMMAWDMRIGGKKCGGGWYDTLTTLPPTYLEQARQTVLGHAKESMLFSYDRLRHDENGINDAEVLKKEIPGLIRLSDLIANKKINGVSVPKTPACDNLTGKEGYLSSFIGMIGIPVDPDIALRDSVPTFLGAQAAGFTGADEYVENQIAKGNHVAMSKEFAEYFALTPDEIGGIENLDTKGDCWNICDLPQERLDALRDYLTLPIGVKFRAPSRVALNLYDDDMEVVQNFNDFEVKVTLDVFGRSKKNRSIALVLSGDQTVGFEKNGSEYTLTIPPRTLALLN